MDSPISDQKIWISPLVFFFGTFPVLCSKLWDVKTEARFNSKESLINLHASSLSYHLSRKWKEWKENLLAKTNDIDVSIPVSLMDEKPKAKQSIRREKKKPKSN